MANTLTGNQLVKDLGIQKFTYIWVQKVLNNPQDIFIVTIDSRMPSVYLSMSKVKTLKFSSLKKLKQYGKEFKFLEYKMSPPYPLREFTGKPNSNSIFMVRDLAGEHFRDKNMFTEQTKKYKIIKVVK